MNGPGMLGISFVSPATGIVAAAVALPALLVLYFLKLRRRPARISSTLLWESAVLDLQANVPFRMIRPSWLLLLQALIVCLLCLALARPALQLPGRGGGLTIIAVDASASMSAVDAPGPRGGDAAVSRLEHAKRMALETADRVIDAGGEVQVVSFAARPRVLSAFSRNRGLVRGVIEGIEATDQPADFDRLVSLLAALTRGNASEEPDAAPPPRVVLVSDGALERRGVSGAVVSPELVEFVRTGPAPESELDNSGIVALAARREFDDPGLVRVFVRVLSSASEERAVALVARLEGRIVDTASVTVPGWSDDAATGERRPGEAGHSLEIRTSEPGLLVVSLARADALSSDDSAAVMLEPPSSPRVLVVFPEGSSGPRTVAESSLLDALRLVEPRTLSLMSSDEYSVRSGAAGFFGGYELVVFVGVRPERLPEIPSVSVAAGLPIAGLGVVGTDGRRGRDFAFWDRAHPVMRGVGLGLVQLDSGTMLVLPAGGDGADRESSEGSGRSEGANDSPRALSTTLASTEIGPAIALLEVGGIRRLVVAPSLDETTWWSDQSFPVFVVNAVEHLTLGGGGSAGVSFETGSEARAALPRALGGVRLAPPGGGAERPVTPLGEGGLVGLGLLPLAGVWEARWEGGRSLLPVNVVDAGESWIRARNEVVIAGTPIGASVGAGVSAREVWPWLVMAAAGLLALEWCVFALRSRV